MTVAWTLMSSRYWKLKDDWNDCALACQQRARIGTARLHATFFLITYEAQLPAVRGRWQGFRRLRDDLSGRIDRRFALSNDPPTAIDHHVRPQAELGT